MIPLIVVALLSLSVEAKKPVCLITAPYVVHVGVEETVTVQLHGASEAVSIHLYFKTHSAVISDIQDVTLNDSNRYQAIVNLKVDPLMFQGQKSHFYIQLVAESAALFKVKNMVNILLSTKRGYLFIQTDKPIYNPGEKVQYRIFTLDNYMLPTDDTVDVQVFNCKGLLVYSHMFRSRQILDRTITIPDVEMAGHWKITASFKNNPKSISSVEFEVREYVLPSFEVNIKATEPYHILSNDVFSFNISARYTYGKGVNGVAYVRFGLVDSSGERTYLPGTEKQATVENGDVSILLLSSELETAAANQNKPIIEGFYLYIAATVLEKASGDLEEAESSSVKIVTSPYVIDLSKTKKYFSPGGMFSIRGATTYPDGSRVPRLKIKAAITIHPNMETLMEESTGNDMGELAITFKVPTLAKTMFITVTVEGSDEEAIVTDAKLEVMAIMAETGSYLSVEVPLQVLQPGQDLQVTFRDITSSSARPSHIYYLVVSKGRVLRADVVPQTNLTSVSLGFSVDMVPSFRLIAYYYTEDSVIVADSVWVDVKDVCQGKVEIAPFADLKPAQHFEVSVRTDEDSTVALSAVDSAVYILNKKNKLSPQKMFDYMNSFDLGCSVGGGKDSSSVLQGAGLTFMCSCGTPTPITAHHVCYNQPHRQKRDLQYSKLSNTIKHQDRKCCDDGRKLGLARTKSCDERLKRTTHQTESCRQAFQKCCEAAAIQRKNTRRQGRMRHLGRTLGSSMEDIMDELAIHLRSYFPESWMWLLMKPQSSGIIRYSTVVPDSITTWEVQAVSISPTKGFCVADPQPLRVFQDFFMSVKLPYSVKKNEQLEVKAVIYNYKQESLEVTVKMEKVEGLCTVGGGDVVEKVSVPGQSATSVYFTVVPLVIGSLPINVLAYASASMSDRVQKQLLVVGEGELVSIHTEQNIDAKNDKKMEFHFPEPDDKVPGQDSATYLSFKGGVMGESVDNCLNLEGVEQLIQLPTGCAEQTMVKMSPAIHAIRYLDATNQWLYLKAERREEAQAMIQTGYNRILTYKKEDGSYGAFLTRPSSVWLTAFIAKELTGSKDIIEVQDLYIQEALSYLMSKQKDTGSWDDPNPLYDKQMKGGVGQMEDDIPLTAFILISMKHSKQVYELRTDTKLKAAISKAEKYLKDHLNTTENPYAMAITAYALSLHNPQSQQAQQAHRKLMQMATCDKDQCFWEASGKKVVLGQKADALSVEATAYGLLQAVTMQDKAKAVRAAAWLTHQRKYGGGFRSTQDTVVALEALSKFSIQNNDVEDLDLKVEMCVNSKQTQNLHLTKNNALTQKVVEIKEVGKVALNVKGRGKGTLSIMQTYRSLKKDESHCDHFHITVQVEGELALQPHEEGEQYDDYYNYETADEEVMDRVDWFDLHSRRKRHVPEESRKESTLIYTVCLGLKQGNSSSMVVVDISLLSGLTPNIQDLEDNAKGTEKYIDHYDLHQNKVFLYFNQITEAEECVHFRAEQLIPIGLVQPASAVIYDYYSPDRRCGIFYTAPKSSAMLSKLCKGDVCTCAEGGCARSRVTFSKSMEQDTRKRYACYDPSVDYIYTIKVLNSSDDAVFTTYSTFVTKVLQTGKDVAVQTGAYREMTQRLTCDDVQLKNDGEYLIMGDDSTIFTMNNAHRRFLYILDNKMWIEEIPERKRCRATRNKQACQLLQHFMDDYLLKKCSD